MLAKIKRTAVTVLGLAGLFALPEGSRGAGSYKPDDPGRSVLRPRDVTPEGRAGVNDRFLVGGPRLMGGFVLLRLGDDEEQGS